MLGKLAHPSFLCFICQQIFTQAQGSFLGSGKKWDAKMDLPMCGDSQPTHPPLGALMVIRTTLGEEAPNSPPWPLGQVHLLGPGSALAPHLPGCW